MTKGQPDKFLNHHAAVAAEHVRSHLTGLATKLEPGRLARHDPHTCQPACDYPAGVTPQDAASAVLRWSPRWSACRRAASCAPSGRRWSCCPGGRPAEALRTALAEHPAQDHSRVP